MDTLRKHYLRALRRTAIREKTPQRVYDRNFKCVGWAFTDGSFVTGKIDCAKFVAGVMVSLPRDQRAMAHVVSIRQLRGVQQRAA